jgi:hypothetical protein
MAGPGGAGWILFARRSGARTAFIPFCFDVADIHCDIPFHTVLFSALQTPFFHLPFNPQLNINDPLTCVFMQHERILVSCVPFFNHLACIFHHGNRTASPRKTSPLSSSNNRLKNSSMEEQQIVLHSSAVPPEAESQLVVRASDDVGIPQAQRMEALRQDREAHRHKQIWIKDPHGGPYRKVGQAQSLPFAVKPDVDSIPLHRPCRPRPATATIP